MGNCINCEKSENVLNSLNQCDTNNTELWSLHGKTLPAKIIAVYDGDTVTAAIPLHTIFTDRTTKQTKIYALKCRLMGINCPEIKTKDVEEKEKGLAARDRLRILTLNHIVQLQCFGWDKYGRLLVEIHVGAMNINTQLLADGYAKPYMVTA